jgi:peptide/nickel transport system permease protein
VVRGVVALVLFQTLLFGLVNALPYDFSSIILGSPDYRRFISARLGLDLPLLERYFGWLLSFLQLDLGRSYLFWPTPVSVLLRQNAARTLILFLTGAILAYLLGIWLGKTIAWRRGGPFELGASLIGVASYTSFAPFLGFLMLNLLGRYLGWFPYQRLIDHNVWFNASVPADWVLALMVATGLIAFGLLLILWRATRRTASRRRQWALRIGGLLLVGLGGWAWWARSGMGHLALDVLAHLMLPLGTVVLLSFGETMMLMRAAMLEAMGENYVLMAQAKGLPGRVVRDRHVARMAILPVLTRLLLNLPAVLVGSLVVERVFLWHAMGQVLFTAIEYYDLPVLLGVLSVVGILTLAAHVVLDVIYVYLDPRLRYARGD